MAARFPLFKGATRVPTVAGVPLIIEQLKGKQAVAIDLSKRELDEAPGDPLLKIVMDARDLKFVDGSFPTATSPLFSRLKLYRVNS